jgi:hypothetical protein
MSRIPVQPYLIEKDEEGRVRLTVRETYYNSQGYPLINQHVVEQEFETATAARNYAKEHLGAVAGQFAAK